LEAAIIIPLIAGFLAMLLNFFRVIQVETQVYSALSYASRKTAVLCSETESNVAALASAEIYFRKALSENATVTSYIKGGESAIILATSDFSGDYVDLKAYYQLKLPVSFFRVSGLTIFQESKSKKWTGRNIISEDDSWVYITEHGTVYHASKNCHYLDLSIQVVKVTDLADLRNKNGHKYYICEYCAAKNISSQDVYITDYGTTYHTDLQCSGLKRTIYQIKRSSVKNMNGCSKCTR
jgi:hypothetical protein